MNEEPDFPWLTNDRKLSFVRVEDSNIAAAFAVLKRVGEWIESQGRRQRISKTTFETYQKWQADNANFSVTEDDQIVGLATLSREPLDEWPGYAELGPQRMIRALATHPDHQGKKIGPFAVAEALRRCRPEAVYLDCVSEFLPQYYAQLGFYSIARQQRTYDDGEYDITLMRFSPGTH